MRIPVVVKVGAFAVLVMAGYSGFANSIPQIESKPPQELSLEGGNVTPAQLIKAGEEIFKTKGTCEICHRIGQKGTRAPDLGGIGARAGKTKPGMSAKAYIIESLLQPSAYIVEGYPPIMPAVDKPPIALNRSEVSQIAKIQPPDYIMKKILDPKGSGTVAGFPPGVMPQDFGTRLTSKEYVDLVAFLLTLK